MKLTPLFCRYFPKDKFTTEERKIIFKPELPLRLRNHVSTKTTKQTQKNCLQEMYDMMACLKKYEFEQSECPKEIQIFRSCCKTAGTPDVTKDTVVRKDFNTQQMNKYLKKFQQDFRF